MIKREKQEEEGNTETGNAEEENIGSIRWTKTIPPEWNNDIRITVDAVDGEPKEYYLAYAAVRMTKENAMKYISALSNVTHVEPSTSRNE